MNRSTLAAFVLGIFISQTELANAENALTLRAISREAYSVGEQEYEFGLFYPDEVSLSGFVFTLHQAGVLRSLMLFDGNAPTVKVVQLKSGSHWAQLRFVEGAHEHVMRFYQITPAGLQFTKGAEIRSGAGCIYQKSDSDIFTSVDIEHGKYYAYAYQLTQKKLRHISRAPI